MESKSGPLPVEANNTSTAEQIEQGGFADFPSDKFTVAMSVATVGSPRSEEGVRSVLAGNMSHGYAQPDKPEIAKKAQSETQTDEEYSLEEQHKEQQRIELADNNLHAFAEHMGIEANARGEKSLYISFPQGGWKPGTLRPVEVTSAMIGTNPKENKSDLVWTKENIALGFRPADCPVVCGMGTNQAGEDISFALHVGWQGLNAGYFEEGIQFLLDDLSVMRDTLNFYVAPSAHKENFPFSNNAHPVTGTDERFYHEARTKEDREALFTNVTENEDPEKRKYDIEIDMLGYVLYALTNKFGIEKGQIFVDTTDTASPESGHSSHSRATRGEHSEKVNTRDVVVIKRNQ